MILLSLVSLLGISAIICRRLEVSSATALLLATSVMLLTLYLGGLADVLWWSALGLHLAGVLTATFMLLGLALKGNRPRLTLPVIVFVVILALFWIVHRQSQFYFYDEYSHWGIFLKDMLAYDRFWGPNSNTMQPRYVPGPTLWQYFFSVLAPQRTDSIAYMAQFVLLIVPLMILWEGLRCRQVGWTLGALLLCLIGLANFSPGIASLYVDHLLSTWFIGTLLCFVRDGSTRLSRILWFALPLGVLALIKEAGLAFALAAAAIIAMLCLHGIWSERGASTSKVIRAALTAAVLVIPAFLSYQSWQLNRDAAGVETSKSAAREVVAALVAEDDADQALRSQISRRFLEVLLSQQLSKNEVSWQFNAFSYPLRELYRERFRLSIAGFLVMYVAWQLFLLTRLMRGECRWRWGILAGGLLVTAIGYLGMLFVNYTSALGEYGLLLSSSLRYFHTIALILFIAAFAPLLPGFRPPGTALDITILGRPVSRTAILFASGLVLFSILERPHISPLISENRRIPLREQTAAPTTAIRELAGTTPVWIFLANDQPNEFIGRFLQFQLSPTPATVERSVEFLDRSKASILDAWSAYSILWFPAGAPEALIDAGVLATASPTRLYRVRNESGQIRIEPLETSDQDEPTS